MDHPKSADAACQGMLAGMSSEHVARENTDQAAEPTDKREGLEAFSSWKSSWRHSPLWVYALYTLVSLVALAASLILAAEALYSARHPGALLGCDINGTLSCSAVARSWQAEIVHIGRYSYPNAFLGIAAESVFVTTGVVGMTGARLPRWFSVAWWWGGLAALGYSYWLTTQSLFVINALCPWCLTIMFMTTIQFMALTHATVVFRCEPREKGCLGGLRRFLDDLYRPNLDLLVDVGWVMILVIIILAKDGPAIFR